MCQKGGRCMREKVYKLILAVSLIVVVVASVNIARLAKEYQAGINEYKDLEQYVAVVEEPEQRVEDKTEEEVQESQIPVLLDIDFDKLEEINSDVVGWLYYAPLEISYPIVRGNDNEYYTQYTFEQEKNSSGAIFMDFLNRTDLTDYNTIVYGHNMRNGTMFGSLKKLLNDTSYLEEDPYFYVYTKDKAYMYEIASVYITNEESDTYNLIGTREDQQEYISYILETSTWLWDKELTPEDKIMTLSTCHGLHSTNRTVVHGVLIVSEDRQ